MAGDEQRRSRWHHDWHHFALLATDQLSPRPGRSSPLTSSNGLRAETASRIVSSTFLIGAQSIDAIALACARASSTFATKRSRRIGLSVISPWWRPTVLSYPLHCTGVRDPSARVSTS